MPQDGAVYTLLGADGRQYVSETAGLLGGNSKDKIYGKLDCWSALRWVGRGYERIRVFFADEETAIAAGYRPCGHCMRDRYHEWKSCQPETP